MTPTRTPTLTLAIPAHNDRAPLLRLLACAGRLDCVAHVVVVDDGSDVPLDADELRTALGGGLTLLRHDTAQGPGPARNRALTAVTTRHVLFVDADDLVTDELSPLMRDLNGRDFDFCLFQYHDTRLERGLLWGQMIWDQQFWQASGVALGALNTVPPTAAAQLAGCANYPWNKIYRTDFLRDHAIACSDILLHEDVELHWRSFIHARHILASDRIGVIHFVQDGGRRLTNRTGPERLEVFTPLARIARELEAQTQTQAQAQTQAPHIYAVPFARFTLGLIAWISNNLDPAYHAQLETLTQAFMQNHAALMAGHPAPAQIRAAMPAPGAGVRRSRLTGG